MHELPQSIGPALQHLPNFLKQGKHYVAGLGQARHEQTDVVELSALYESHNKGRTVAAIAGEVRVRVGSK